MFSAKEAIDFINIGVKDLNRPSEKLTIGGVRTTKNGAYTLVVQSNVKARNRETGEVTRKIYNYTRKQAFDRLVFMDGKPFRKLKEKENEI